MAREITEHPGDLKVATVGRKGRDAMRRAGVPIAAHFEGFGDRPQFADVLPLARLVTDDFRRALTTGSTSSTPGSCPRWSRRPSIEQLLPVGPSRTRRGSPATSSCSSPTPGLSSRPLLPRYVATRLFQAVLESKASEESSRMVAMKNATENAQELIEDLTLSYNKVRQANITREMVEIASGAQAR